MRIDLRKRHCFPYPYAIDQGSDVSCVVHALSLASYCARCRSAGSSSCLRDLASPYPDVASVYQAALEESSSPSIGVSFEGGIEAFYRLAEEHIPPGLVMTTIPVRGVRSVVREGYVAVIGYQLSAAGKSFHQDASIARDYDFVIPALGPEDEVVDSHAVAVVGFDDDVGAFIVRNTWGGEWGLDGHFWLGYEDLAREEFVTDAAAVISRELWSRL